MAVEGGTCGGRRPSASRGGRLGAARRGAVPDWRRGRVAVPPSAPDALRRRPVGVFDSGVGGLTVLHELLVQLPHEDFVYFADSARVPYGPRPREEIEAFSLEVAEELLARRIKLLVVACNSASSAALPALRERLMQTTLGRRRARRRAARRGAGRGRDAQRPRRLHGDRGDGGQRRVRAGDRGGGPVRDRRRRRLPGARAADRARLAVRRRDRRRGAPLHAPAARRGGGHGDPRLHALPADPRRCCSACSAAAWRSSAPASRSRGRSSTCSAAAGSATRATARATTAS